MIVVVDIAGQNSAQVALPEDHDPVQTFLAHRPDPAFCEGICIRCLHRRANERDIPGGEDGIKGCWKLAIPVVDQEAHRQPAILDLPTQLACHALRVPGHPSTRRVCGTTSEVDTSAPQFDKEEDVDGFQPHRFDGEEVTRDDVIFVVCEEGTPSTAVLRTLRCGRHVLALQDIANRRAPNRVPEFAQLTR